MTTTSTTPGVAPHAGDPTLGPWPWYVAVEIALVAIVWALMTLPWQSRQPRDREAVRTR